MGRPLIVKQRDIDEILNKLKVVKVLKILLLDDLGLDGGGRDVSSPDKEYF